METIFVLIPSYRDPECPLTLDDLFAKAKHPERVFVGLCLQLMPEDHEWQPKAHPQVRTIFHCAQDSKGPSWACHEAESLWQGEDYILMTEPHIRFIAGWDEELIHALKLCPSKKSLLSVYPNGYPEDWSQVPLTPPNIMTIHHINNDIDEQLTYARGKAINYKADKPILGHAIGTGFIFANAKFFQEVPNDEYLYWGHDEINFAIRAWTHGWDVYHPHKNIIFHNWDRAGRGLHWDDDARWKEYARIGRLRSRHLYGIETCHDPQILKDLDKYGLGTERSIKDYQKFSGIDLLNEIIEPRTFMGQSYFNSQHKPVQILETEDVRVYDNFLPEDVYEKLYHYATQCDYESINTHGSIQKVFRPSDGFPLRSQQELFFQPKGVRHPQPYDFPTDTALDIFAEYLWNYRDFASPIVGHVKLDWQKFSSCAWIYPPRTGLSLHADGYLYSGAYVFFLNKKWNIHWNGHLIILDPKTKINYQKIKLPGSQTEEFILPWLDDSDESSQTNDPGIAHCIFPKGNRIVFLSSKIFHFISEVSSRAGQHCRMSLAGFFIK